MKGWISSSSCALSPALIYCVALRHQLELTGQRGVDVDAVAAYIFLLPEYVTEMYKI